VRQHTQLEFPGVYVGCRTDAVIRGMHSHDASRWLDRHGSAQMNDEMELHPVTLHRAMQPGCRHWAPIVLPVSNTRSDAETGPAQPEFTETPTVVAEPTVD